MEHSGTIALDIGNVCLTIHPERCFESLGLEVSNLPGEVALATNAMETGTITPEKWLEKLRAETKDAFPDTKLAEAYNSIIGATIPSTAEFAETAVELGYKLVFLSDTSRIHLNEVRLKLEFAHLVTGGVYSFEVGAKKPAPAMFDRCEEIYGKPSLFLDDKAGNAAAARNFGWNAVEVDPRRMSAKDIHRLLRRG